AECRTLPFCFTLKVRASAPMPDCHGSSPQVDGERDGEKQYVRVPPSPAPPWPRRAAAQAVAPPKTTIRMNAGGHPRRRRNAGSHAMAMPPAIGWAGGLASRVRFLRTSRGGMAANRQVDSHTTRTHDRPGGAPRADGGRAKM